MSKAKIVIAILLVVTCGIALILLPHREAETERAPARVGGISLYGYTKEGDLAWAMTAEEGEIDKETEDLTGISIRFPEEDGTYLVISAPSLVQKRGLRRLSGGVRIEREDGLIMTCDSLDWDDEASLLSADRVELSYGKIEASGGGFRYDIEGEISSFSNGVEGKIEREGAISVRGERAEESGGRIVIIGNVLVRSEEDTYRCDRLESDGEGEEVVLTGGVTALMSEGKLIGERLVIGPDGISASGSLVLDLNLEGENGA